MKVYVPWLATFTWPPLLDHLKPLLFRNAINSNNKLHV
jgi:hypothetical protein